MLLQFACPNLNLRHKVLDIYILSEFKITFIESCCLFSNPKVKALWQLPTKCCLVWSKSCIFSTCQILFSSALQQFRVKTLSLLHSHFKCALYGVYQVILHAFQDSLLSRLRSIPAINQNPPSVSDTHYQCIPDTLHPHSTILSWATWQYSLYLTDNKIEIFLAQF